MAYVLLSQSFGASKANLPVTITEVSTGLPAVILSSATAGLLSNNGDHYLDGSGNLAVYVEGGRTWQVNVDSGASPGPVGLLTAAQIAAGAVGIAGVTSGGVLKDASGSTLSVSSLTLAQTSAGAIGVVGVTSGGVLKDNNGATIVVGSGTSLTPPVAYSASRILSAADAGRQIQTTTTSAPVAFTVPNDGVTGFVGSEGFWSIIVAGANPITYVAGAGVTIVNPNTSAATAVGASLFCTRISANLFTVSN